MVRFRPVGVVMCRRLGVVIVVVVIVVVQIMGTIGFGMLVRPEKEVVVVNDMTVHQMHVPEGDVLEACGGQPDDTQQGSRHPEGVEGTGSGAQTQAGHRLRNGIIETGRRTRAVRGLPHRGEDGMPLFSRCAAGLFGNYLLLR